METLGKTLLVFAMLAVAGGIALLLSRIGISRAAGRRRDPREERARRTATTPRSSVSR